MSDITELILTKYYGFGVNPESKRFVSSHDATYDPSKFYRSSDTTDPSEIDTNAETSGHGTSSEVVKDEVQNSNLADSVGNRFIRSSRAIIDDDILQDENNDINEFEALLESSRPQKEQPPAEEIKISDGKDLLTPKKIERVEECEDIGRNDFTLGNFDDIFQDNVSDISSIPAKKKPKKKSALTAASAVSSQPLPPPKKLPSCNGVFLDLTNLGLTEFPVNMLGNIPNLRMLYLENNSLTKLPDEVFASLKLLQWLDVRNNKLASLPDSIKYHSCLETILLEGNLFEKLPLELCLLPSLKGLQTSRNPLIFPPADILALGFAATINFLRTEWNNSHPDEIIELPERDRKPRPSTILCSDPPIFRTNSKSSRTFGSSSTGRVSEITNKISIKKKSKNYKPSNRYEEIGSNQKSPVNSYEENLQEAAEPTICDSCLKNSTKILESTERSTEADDLDSIVKSSKVKLQKIDPKRCLFLAKSRKNIQSNERVFDIITNDRTVEKLCPMRLQDPDRMCENRGTNEELESRLLWIAKVKEMLTEQTVALQKIKDRDALSDWRRDRRSYEKSMSRAANRTEEDIPFGIDVEDIAAMFKNRLKIPVEGAKSIKRGPAPPRNINEKMMELYESLNRLQEARKSECLSPRSERNLLEKQIKKLSELQDEIQNLKRYNEMSTAPFEGFALLPKSQPYRAPPSIII